MLQRSFIPWLVDFLKERRQATCFRVVIAFRTFTCDLPHNTKVGSLFLFIHINDTRGNTLSRWKYVADSIIVNIFLYFSALRNTLNWTTNYIITINYRKTVIKNFNPASKYVPSPVLSKSPPSYAIHQAP